MWVGGSVQRLRLVETPQEVDVGPMIGFGRTSATYDYEIVQVASGRLVAAAKTVQVWYDYDAGRPVPIPDEARAQLSAPVPEGMQ